MHLDLDFDKYDCENKLQEHESILDQRNKNYFENKSRLDASKYLLQETKSSFKMKSQFQISKKQFFAKIAKDKTNIPMTKARTNLNSSAEKLTTSKKNPSRNSNFAYGSTSSLGSESLMAERKFDLFKKNNPVNSITNAELVVESYALPNKPEHELQDEENIIDQNPPSEWLSKTPDSKGTS